MSPSDAANGQTLLYLVYGKDPKYQLELSYSVLSALREARGPLQILLFCDEANQRPDLPVISNVISDEDRDAWTFGGTYHHVMKIFALRHALAHVGGKVCFVDTDTAFRADPQLIFDRISDTSVAMHAHEGQLKDLHSWTTLLQKAGHTEHAKAVYPDAPMFNSGLIGVTSAQDASLEAACALAKALYAIEPVFNIEQFVLGALLGQSADIRLAEDVLEHYWGYRRYVYHARIPPALATLSDGYSAKTATRLPVISEPPKPLIARLWARIHGQVHGMDANYRFAYLSYLANGAAQDAETRMIWADIALDMLQRSQTRRRQYRDFKRFQPAVLATSGLDPARQALWSKVWAEDGLA